MLNNAKMGVLFIMFEAPKFRLYPQSKQIVQNGGVLLPYNRNYRLKAPPKYHNNHNSGYPTKNSKPKHHNR